MRHPTNPTNPAGAAGFSCGTGRTAAPSLLVAGDLCPLASYCPVGTAAPVLCLPGYFANVTGLATCFACPAGSYSAAGAIACQPCGAGFACLGAGTSSGPTQVPCPGGTWTSSTNLTTVRASRARVRGSESTRASATRQPSARTSAVKIERAHLTAPPPPLVPLQTASCSTCPAGSYCPPGSSAPTQCPRGSYCAAASTLPTPCPAGRYGAAAGATNSTGCAECWPGWFCDSPGLTTPAGLCDPGFYCSRASPISAPGSNAVAEAAWVALLGVYGSVCSAGGYCPAGSSAPVPCPAGTYLNSECRA
jgi:hypothetical protein